VLDDLQFDELVAILEAAIQLPPVEYDSDGMPLPVVLPDPD